MVLEGDVVITTFVNPHLFWIVPKENQERLQKLEEIHQLLEHVCPTKPNRNSCFDIGDFVAVKVNKTLYRAIIEDEDGEPDESYPNKRNYICWLIDYGTMVKNVTEVWKLPTFVRQMPTLAHQASLYNVAYLTEGLSFDEKATPLKNFMAIGQPTHVSKVASLELLSSCIDIQFQLEVKECGIMFGDILYRVDEESSFKSLTEYLIGKSVLMYAPEMFQEIKIAINTFKDKQIKFIVDICASSPYIWETERKMYEKRKRPKPENNSKQKNELTPENKTKPEDKLKPRDTAKPKDKPTPEVESKPRDKPELDDKLKQDIDRATKGRLAKIKKLINEKCGNNNIFRSNQENMFDRESDTSSVNSSASQMGTNVNEDTSSESTHKECITVKQKRMTKKKVSFEILDNQSINCESSEHTTKTTTDELTSDEGSGRIKRETRNKTNQALSSDEYLSEDSTSQSQSCNEHSLSERSSNSDSSRSSLPAYKGNQKKGAKQIGCTCKNCLHWTESDDWKHTDNFHENKKRKLQMPSSNIDKNLFKNEQELADTDVHVLSLEYSSMTKIQQQMSRKFLVHSETIPQPLKNISEVYFHQLVHQSLAELGYKMAKRIQMYTWPALFRNLHAFMINGSQTGKSMTYLPVLCTFILERSTRYNFTGKSTGAPIVIILCSNSSKCENIYDVVLLLLGKGKAKVSLITYPLAHVNTSHIDILITTPLILTDLMKSNAINLKRLCHFVLEDADNIFKRFKIVCDKITDAIQSTLSNRLDQPSVQMIVCAEHWTKHLTYLYRRLRCTPFVCIGNSLEAALYGKIRFSLEFLNSACKEMKLKAILKESYRIQKSLVVCREDDLEDIEEFLRLKGIEASVIQPSFTKEQVLDLETAWNCTCSGEHTVLVCTDFHLNTFLSVTSVELLIHYSLPMSWSKFVQRFSCMLESCRSPLQKYEPSIPSQSIVLCDEMSLVKMNKFFKNLYAIEIKNLTDRWKECAKESQSIEEEEKLNLNVGVCNSLKLFGKCQELIKCPWRHLISRETDFREDIPFKGKIKFKILNIHDVTKFSIRILEHSDEDNNIHKFEVDTSITQDLTESLTVKKRSITNYVLGRWYAFLSDNETYKRCELISIDGEDCEIKLIDSGLITNTSKSSLYMLPKQFDHLHRPTNVVDMFLANLVPPYQDDCFSSKAFFKLKTKMETNDYQNKIFTGKIHLQLAATLWLKDVCEEIVLSDKTVFGPQLSSTVTSSMLAVASPEQLHSLLKLCEEVHIEAPVYESFVKNEVVKEQAKPQWAHFSSDDVEEVYFCSAVSISEFYVRLKKFFQLEQSLQKEINEDIRKPNYPSLKEIHEGTICLAKDLEENYYNRGVVLEIEKDNALVFFVDDGFDAVLPIKNLRYIQNKHITKLPFQSIKCSLHGIKPLECQNGAIDTLYTYATEPKCNIFRTLFLKVCNKETPHLQNQNAYSVLLKDSLGTKNILINSLLIDSGWVASAGEPLTDFKITISDGECSEDMENDESVEMTPNSYIQDELDEDNSDFEFVITDPLEFFRGVSHFGETEPSSSRSKLAIQSASAVDHSTPMVAAPPVDYCTPKVLWSQIGDNIKMAIKLAGIHECKVAVFNRISFQFSTVRDTKTYKLNVILYAAVQLVEHSVVGPEIRVTLRKVKNEEWPRLILSKERAWNIRYDCDSIPEEKQEKRRILQLPKELDDDSDSNDDVIDIMYHNVSDLDSEFDQDLQEDSDS